MSQIEMKELYVLEPDLPVLVCLDKTRLAGRTKIQTPRQRMLFK
jgi:hypothetical protein